MARRVVSKIPGYAAAVVSAFSGFVWQPAYASTMFPVTAECPVGGEKFSSINYGSYSTWGSRPDGRPYGSADFPLHNDVCPKNGLVIFKTFSAEELSALPPILEREDFKAMRNVETNYYRGAWLAQQLGLERDSLFLLIKAGWETDGDVARKRRYQSEFVDRVPSVPLSRDDMAATTLHARRVNALRELGRFDEAKAALKAFPGYGDVPAAIREKTGVDGYLSELEQLINARDASAEPLGMISPREAGIRCMKNEADKNSPVCQRPKVQMWLRTFNAPATLGKAASTGAAK